METLNFSVLCAKLLFPPQIQLFFQNTYSDQIFCKFRTGWTSMFAFCTKKREKANINKNIETLYFSVLYGKLRFPPHIQLFFENTYSDQIFCKFRTGWTSIIPFCAKKREKANINKNMETLNFSVLCAKLLFPPQIQLFFQNTYLHEKFFITSLLKSPHSNASRKIWLFPELLPVGIEAYIYLHVKKNK